MEEKFGMLDIKYILQTFTSNFPQYQSYNFPLYYLRTLKLKH